MREESLCVCLPQNLTVQKGKLCLNQRGSPRDLSVRKNGESVCLDVDLDKFLILFQFLEPSSPLIHRARSVPQYPSHPPLHSSNPTSLRFRRLPPPPPRKCRPFQPLHRFCRQEFVFWEGA
ncbi:BnaCnng50970D [Brassica napus]|uniref:BnaCnng50970D protein n=1 Tax=Brassica napus TaxID=3708 RepID=A0A078JJ12_BRANA|nr:BnaCnng50970D [Brassica napus]